MARYPIGLLQSDYYFGATKQPSYFDIYWWIDVAGKGKLLELLSIDNFS